MKQSENQMGTKAIFPLLMGMSVPPMISMLIQSLYNIVDSIFVAKLGEEALTAVSLAYPLQNLVLAVAVGLGVATNAAIARNLGAKKSEEANDAAAHGLVLTGIHSIFFILLGIFFTKPFLQMFTDNPSVLEWSCQYSYIVICLSFGSLFHIEIEKMFQATGNMFLPMIMQGVGAIVNIILDPIMIFGLFGFPAMGVRGAATATILGQFSACMLSIILFCRHSGGLQIHMKGFRMKGRIVRQLYLVAVPSTVMMSLPSILIGVLNGILGAVSQTAVAVLGVYFKLQMFVYMPANGIIQGMRPIISYNYGAGAKKRLHETIKVSVLVTAVIMAVGTILFMGFPEPVLSLFSATEEMQKMGAQALRIIGTGFIVSALGTVFAGVFESMGKGIASLIVSLLRQLVIIVPCSLMLIKVMGVAGVWLTFPVSEAVAAVVASILLYRMMKKI